MTSLNNLDELLMQEMSKRNTLLVADLVVRRLELFDELFRIYMRNEEPVSRRAAWVVDTVAEQLPDLLLPHLAEIIEMLTEFSHDGLKRHSLRMLSRSPLPGEESLGKLIRISFDWLLAPSESIAVKVYCMELIYRISQEEPDLKKELADSIEWRIGEESAGFQNRGSKLIRKLRLEIDHTSAMQ